MAHKAAPPLSRGVGRHQLTHREASEMIDPASQVQLKEAIADCIGTDQGVLDGRGKGRP